MSFVARAAAISGGKKMTEKSAAQTDAETNENGKKQERNRIKRRRLKLKWKDETKEDRKEKAANDDQNENIQYWFDGKLSFIEMNVWQASDERLTCEFKV